MLSICFALQLYKLLNGLHRFDQFFPKSALSNGAKGWESIAYPIRMFGCFSGPIHSTKAWDSRVNPEADN